MIDLLKNPGFEEGWHYQDGIQELKVGIGWRAWFVDEGKVDPIWKNPRPEYNLCGEPLRVHGGEKSQQYGRVWSTHLAGLYQQVEGVPLGARLRFSVWGYVFGVRGEQSADHPGNLHLKIGLDPTGGVDPFADTVVWSGEVGDYRDGVAYTEGGDEPWHLFSVEAVTLAEAATVFVHSNPEWPLNNMAAQWDDAELCVVGERVTLSWEPREPRVGDWLVVEARSAEPLANVSLEIATPSGGKLAHSEVTVGRDGNWHTWTWATDPLDEPGVYRLAFAADGGASADAVLECEGRTRGLPRVDYSRTVVLMPPDADSVFVRKIIDWTWNRYRWTISNSADDCGIAPLTNKRVIVIDPQAWE